MRGQRRWTRPETYLPNAVLAEVFVVAENDDLAGHGCTDAEPVLNLKASEEKGASLVCTVTAGKERGLTLGTAEPWTR